MEKLVIYKHNGHFVKPTPSKGWLYTSLNIMAALGFLLLGCKTPSPVATKKETTSRQEQLAEVPIIVTFILKLTQKEEASQPFFALHKKVEAKGYLKNKSHPYKMKPNGAFIVELINSAGIITQVNIFANPLLKNYEFTDDEGRFQRKVVRLQEEYISIKIQKAANISALHIYIIEEQKQILLQKIKA